MLKAGALFYAIVVTLLIAVISSSLILYAYFNRSQLQSLGLQEKVLINAASGINLLLAGGSSFPLDEIQIIDLYGEYSDSVMVLRKQWGAFEIAVSKAFSKGFVSMKTAQIGANIHDDPHIALYLADQDKPLSLCGKTEIKGTCYLPKSGAKRAYIEGQSFMGNHLINGETKISERLLPEVNKDLLESNLRYFKKDIQKNDSVLYIEEVEVNDSVTRSFSQRTLLLYSDHEINLENKYYHGNIRVVSAHSVYVPRTANLQDVLIYAPVVEIEDDFTGNLQVFATDSIQVGKRCSLNYPSVIALLRTDKSKGNIELTIGERSILTGVLLGYQDISINQLKIAIGKEVLIKGQVYAKGYVELKGKVAGNLTCDKFILNTPSSVYDNHLLNATIDYSGLSTHFTGVSLLQHAQSKQIVKWLY